MIGLNLDKKCIDAILVNLSNAFIWEQSKEGHKYWADVYDKLEHYRNLEGEEKND